MSEKYDRYIDEHRENVKKAFNWLKTNFPIIDKDIDISEYEENILNHDASKFDPEEYEAYDAYFYGGNKSYEVIRRFDRAWLTHIHKNPHHWQHWILINDKPDEGEIILEMPDIYIIEMICDWWSFSFAKGDLTEIFKWYDERKNYIKLGEDTRERVESILSQIKEKLSESESYYGEKED